MAYVVMLCTATAYVVMLYMVVAYRIMDYIVMASRIMALMPACSICRSHPSIQTREFISTNEKAKMQKGSVEQRFVHALP